MDCRVTGARRNRTTSYKPIVMAHKPLFRKKKSFAKVLNKNFGRLEQETVKHTID